jgi:hypothetical protein
MLASYDPKAKDPKASTFESLKAAFLENLNPAAAEIDNYKSRVTDARTIGDLASLLRAANYIEIKDKGHGLSLADLRNVYLTIGTRSRLEEREELKEIFERQGERITAETKRPVLGEKGVGRLSTMRLGDYLELKTTRSGESRWNLLSIDWARFSHSSDQLLEDIKISPRYGEEKESRDTQGTAVQIFRLKSEWTRLKLEEIAKKEFSKLTDPFTPAARYPIKLPTTENQSRSLLSTNRCLIGRMQSLKETFQKLPYASGGKWTSVYWPGEVFSAGGHSSSQRYRSI